MTKRSSSSAAAPAAHSPPTGCTATSSTIAPITTPWRSRSSTRTTTTCTNPACCSCRSAWPSTARSCGRARPSCTRDIEFVEQAIDRVDIAPRHRRPRRRPRAGLRRAGHRHRRQSGVRRDRGPHRPRLEREGVHLLRPRRRHRPRDGARRLRGRQAGRQRGRHADQVPGRPARVLLPRRLVLHRARHPRQGGDHLRHTARRRVHQAGRLGRARGAAGGEGHPPRHRVQHRRSGRATATTAASSSATTAARCRSTWPWSCRCTAAPTTSAAARAWATTSTSCPPTSARCRPTRRRTSSPSATPPTCRPPRPAR